MVFIEGFKSPQLSKPSNLQVDPLTAQRHSFFLFFFSRGILQGRLPLVIWLLVPEQEEECQDICHQTQNNCFIIPDLLTSMEVPFSAQGDTARAQFWARVHFLPINCLAVLLPFFFTSFALSKRLSPNPNSPLSSGLYSWDSHCLTLLEVHLNPFKTKPWEYIQEKESYIHV